MEAITTPITVSCVLCCSFEDDVCLLEMMFAGVSREGGCHLDVQCTEVRVLGECWLSVGSLVVKPLFGNHCVAELLCVERARKPW